MRSPLTPTRSQPYPELVEPRARSTPYRVIDTRGGAPGGEGCVSKVEREIAVPLDPRARSISRHELAHVAWSPRRLPRCAHDPAVLQVVEDARVNLGLAWLRQPAELAPEQLAYVRWLALRDVSDRDWASFALRTVASIGTNAYARVLDAAAVGPAELGAVVAGLARRVRWGLARARRRHGGPVAPFLVGYRLAAELARSLERLGLLNEGRTGRPLAAGIWHGARVEAGEGADARRRMRSPEELLAGRGSPCEPGRMHVRVAPLTLPCGSPSGRAARGWKPSTEGSLVGAPQRWAIDGAIFRRRAGRSGGTVLVDVSGSMQLDADGLARLVAATRGPTQVAMYSGDGDRGELLVVARHGRRADPSGLERCGRGNIVDLPALEWLARQPAPRVWISDGGVTGIGDRPSPELLERCTSVCHRAGIRRVPNPDRAVALLGGHDPG